VSIGFEKGAFSIGSWVYYVVYCVMSFSCMFFTLLILVNNMANNWNETAMAFGSWSSPVCFWSAGIWSPPLNEFWVNPGVIFIVEAYPDLLLPVVF